MGDRFKDEDVDEMYKEAPIKNGMFDYVEFTRYTCFSRSTGIKTDELGTYNKENLLPLALTPPHPPSLRLEVTVALHLLGEGRSSIAAVLTMHPRHCCVEPFLTLIASMTLFKASACGSFLLDLIVKGLVGLQFVTRQVL